MRPQAHTASALLIWSCGPRHLAEAPVAALCGNLPDLDRSVAKRLGVTRRDHHRWVSHSFIGWAPATAVLLRVARSSRHGGAIRRGVLAVWVHLALDTYADGIAWLWPLYKDKLGFFRRPPEIHDDGWNTPAPLHTNLGRTEAVMWFGVVLNLVRP